MVSVSLSPPKSMSNSTHHHLVVINFNGSTYSTLKSIAISHKQTRYLIMTSSLNHRYSEIYSFSIYQQLYSYGPSGFNNDTKYVSKSDP